MSELMWFSELVNSLRAAGHNETLACGELYLAAADRIAELEALISSGFQQLSGRDVADALIENAELKARLDAVDALEVLTNGEAEVFASLHGFDPGFVRADHFRKALGGDDD